MMKSMGFSESDKLFQDFPPVSAEAWDERVIKDMKGADYAKRLIWESPEGFPVKPYYTCEDLKGLEYLNTLPGRFPFIRGFRTGGTHWTIRQDIQTSHVESANSAALNAIRSGAQAIGFNVNEINDQRQMRTLLDGIDLEKTAIHFFGSPTYLNSSEWLLNEIGFRGSDPNLITGSVDFDPLGYLLLHGDFNTSFEKDLDEAETLMKTLERKLPGFKTIGVNGFLFQDGGSTLVQELAFALATGNEYLARLTDRGLSPDLVAPRILFSFALGSSYFMEIAKLRVARLLWSVIAEQYKPVDLASCRMNIHAVTARWNKTIFDPYVNLLRTTTEGMSGALGNADSISILPFNIPEGFTDPFAERIARNQQLILKEEAYIDKVADPSAGSYFIEKMTDSMAFHAWELFKQVEELGGMTEAITQGFVQDIVATARKQKEMDLARRKLLLLGTNQYPDLNERLAEKGKSEIKGSESPAIEKDLTTFKRILPFRAAEPFEKLRLDTERYVASGKKQPEVFLFTYGNLAMFRARAVFATNFFGCAGYRIIDNNGFNSIDQGVSEALESRAEIVVICSSDPEYSGIVPEITRKLKVGSPSILVIVAGYPSEIIDELKQAGVDGFVHLKSNLLEELTSYQHRLGVK